MRYVIILLALLFTATHGNSQGTFTARQKALLDLYYAQAQSNSISGIWIETNSIPLNRVLGGELFVTNVVSLETTFNGASIIDNLLTIQFKIETDPLWAAWVDTNTYIKTETDPLFGAWTSTNTYVKVEVDPSGWSFATNNIAASTSTVQPRTISVSGTNLFVCVTNNWAGVGTNWMKTTLVDF